MIIPKVTCLPTFDVNLVCHLHASPPPHVVAPRRRLAGKPGGLLYVEEIGAHASQQQAALQGWSSWLIQHDFTTHRSAIASAAKPYLKLGFLFGEPEFGLSPEVALPMYLQENNAAAGHVVTIQSDEIGKQLACTQAGNLYTVDMDSATSNNDAVWHVDWRTPEICCIISAEQGLRLSCNTGGSDAAMTVSDGGGTYHPSSETAATTTAAKVEMVQAHAPAATGSHWRFMEQGDGTIAIVSHDEKYVLGDNWQSQITLSSPEPGPIPTWRVTKTSARGVVLQSVATNRYLTASPDGTFSMQDDASSNALFWFEPIHGSKFNILHSVEQHKNVDLSDVLIKVFDNGNVIIKRDGQFFGECHWKGEYLGVGFGDHPYVWNFEATAEGPIRIVTKDNKYLTHDGKAFGLGHPDDENDSNKADDTTTSTATKKKKKTNNTNNVQDKYLWHLKAKNDKITIGMRYGLLPKKIQKQASAKWPAMHAFQPTLAMAGEFQRPFANWRAWPVVKQQQKQAPQQEEKVEAVNGSTATVVAPVNETAAPVNGVAVEAQAPPAAPVAEMTAPPPPSPPQQALETHVPQTPATTAAPPAVQTPQDSGTPVLSSTPVIPSQELGTPILSSTPLQSNSHDLAPETPVPTKEEIEAYKKTLAQQEELQKWSPPPVEPQPSQSTAETQQNTRPSASPRVTADEQAPRPMEDQGFTVVETQENFRFFNADTNTGPTPPTTTQWPGNKVSPQQQVPQQPPPVRTMNGRPLAADNTSSYGRGGPNYQSPGEDSNGPRIFTVDRT